MLKGKNKTYNHKLKKTFDGNRSRDKELKIDHGRNSDGERDVYNSPAKGFRTAVPVYSPFKPN